MALSTLLLLKSTACLHTLLTDKQQREIKAATVKICVKNQQMHQLFNKFINYVW
jgi:hypothetical protein